MSPHDSVGSGSPMFVLRYVGGVEVFYSQPPGATLPSDCSSTLFFFAVLSLKLNLVHGTRMRAVNKAPNRSSATISSGDIGG